MSDPKELDALAPGEAKRQREALRRKIERGGPNLMVYCGLINPLSVSFGAVSF